MTNLTAGEPEDQPRGQFEVFMQEFGQAIYRERICTVETKLAVRLGRPAWLFNYNGEDHGPAQDHNRRDWSIRMQQFFDHYLEGASAPVWLARGVPATEKGKPLGLDLIEDDKANKNK